MKDLKHLIVSTIKKYSTVKLSVCFTFLISIILIVASFLITVYIGSNTKEYVGLYESKLKNLNTTIDVVLIKLVKRDIIAGKKNKTTKTLINELHNAGVIEDIDVTDRTTDKVVFSYIKGTSPSSDSEYSRQEQELTSKYSVIISKPKNNAQHDNFRELMLALNKYIAHVILAIIIVGVIAGMFMSDIISSSLEKLSKAAKLMSNGKFNIKIPESRFVEINELIASYNLMGKQLSELYTSLEQKVQERTNELKEANSKLKETQAMMVHSEKMRSLGELVAGIAHEINNPVNFIHGNIMILQNYSDDLLKLIDLYDSYSDALTTEQKTEIEDIKKEIDLEFLRGDIKDLIKSCIEGTQRTKNIVLDLKNFSRMEEMVLTEFDIPKEIDTTLNILNNKYKNRITVIRNYAPDVPKIEAYGGQLNQVFMNILDNAQDAIEGEGKVTINVRIDENNKSRVRIEFIDTGSGISSENIKKVFDPFFTTKTVGKGTGLGMSISYRVIKDHNGTIDIQSALGKGTKFSISLPINHETK